jgi:hypothetical protein
MTDTHCPLLHTVQLFPDHHMGIISLQEAMVMLNQQVDNEQH